MAEIIARREKHGAATAAGRRLDGVIDGRRVERLSVAPGAEITDVEIVRGALWSGFQAISGGRAGSQTPPRCGPAAPAARC